MFVDLKIYAACFVTFIVVDLVWIGLVMKGFYVQHLQPIGRISGDKLGIVQFVLPRISIETPWPVAFGIGALLGFVVYATYDFTNYATLKDWTLVMTFTDIAWGTVLCGVATLAARSVRDFN